MDLHTCASASIATSMAEMNSIKSQSVDGFSEDQAVTSQFRCRGQSLIHEIVTPPAFGRAAQRGLLGERGPMGCDGTAIHELRGHCGDGSLRVTSHPAPVLYGTCSARKTLTSEASSTDRSSMELMGVIQGGDVGVGLVKTVWAFEAL